MGLFRFLARPRSRRPLVHVALAVALPAFVAYQSNSDERAVPAHPQQAGQPVNPYAVARHITGARMAAVAGDSRAAQAHIGAIARDLTRSARMPDVFHPIDHEAARAAVRPLPGVRSAVWLDAANFVVMVDGAQQRSMAMIDRVCLALEPLGDTLAVVVNLQNVTAKEPDAATTLSRNCQLPEGQRAFMQAKQEVDVVGSELRQASKAQQR